MGLRTRGLDRRLAHDAVVFGCRIEFQLVVLLDPWQILHIISMRLTLLDGGALVHLALFGDGLQVGIHLNSTLHHIGTTNAKWIWVCSNSRRIDSLHARILGRMMDWLLCYIWRLLEILLVGLEGINVCLHGDVGLDDPLRLHLPSLGRLPGDQDVLMAMAYKNGLLNT